MNSFETGIAVGYLLKVGKKPKLTTMDVQASTSDNSWHTYNPPTGYDGFEYFRVKGIKEKQDEIERLTRELQEMEECCDEVKDTLEEITGERPVRPEDIITAIEEIAEDEKENEKYKEIVDTLLDEDTALNPADVDCASNSAVEIGDVVFVFKEEWVDHPTYGYRDKQVIRYAIFNGQTYPATTSQYGHTVIDSGGNKTLVQFYNFQILFSNTGWSGKLYLRYQYSHTRGGQTSTGWDYSVWNDISFEDLGYTSIAEAEADMNSKVANVYHPS